MFVSWIGFPLDTLMLLVIIVLVFNVCCAYRMVLLGKRCAHLISDSVGAGPIVIVFSIIVVGCFGLACACFILLGHAVDFFSMAILRQTHCGRVTLDLLFLEYDAF